MHSRKTVPISLVVVGLLALAAGGAGCDQLALPTQPAPATDAGAAMPLANGMIPAGAIVTEGMFAGEPGFFSWVTLDDAGKLKEFGFSIPVPTIERAGSVQVEGYLPLPQPMLDQTVFKTFSLIYLPHGHVPAGVYDIPHWEWHLYTIDKPSVEAIDCSDQRVPNSDQLPPDHIALPACLVHLGMHAYDLKAPEFTGGRFSKGIYGGYYHADFIAVEPKIATSVLLERQDVILPSYDPVVLGPKGTYPKSFRLSYSDAGHSMVLTVSDWFQRN